MKSLFLHYIPVVGTIPTEVDNLSLLTSLGIAGTEIMGTLPSELGQTQLKWVDWDDLNLTGTMPNEFADLTSLRKLHLYLCKSNQRLDCHEIDCDYEDCEDGGCLSYIKEQNQS